MALLARCRPAALLLAGLALAGCGTHQTQLGAAPYQAPTTSAPSAGYDRYPGVQVRFTQPTVTGVTRQVVKSYIAFHVATLRTWSLGHAVPGLRTYATAPVRSIVTQQIATERQLGVADQPSVVHIRRVLAHDGVAGLEVCAEGAGAARPLLVAMTDRDGTWQVSAIAPPKRPLRNCG